MLKFPTYNYSYGSTKLFSIYFKFLAKFLDIAEKSFFLYIIIIIIL